MWPKQKVFASEKCWRVNLLTYLLQSTETLSALPETKQRSQSKTWSQRAVYLWTPSGLPARFRGTSEPAGKRLKVPRRPSRNMRWVGTRHAVQPVDPGDRTRRWRLVQTGSSYRWSVEPPSDHPNLISKVWSRIFPRRIPVLWRRFLRMQQSRSWWQAFLGNGRGPFPLISKSTPHSHAPKGEYRIVWQSTSQFAPKLGDSCRQFIRWVDEGFVEMPGFFSVVIERVELDGERLLVRVPKIRTRDPDQANEVDVITSGWQDGYFGLFRNGSGRFAHIVCIIGKASHPRIVHKVSSLCVLFQVWIRNDLCHVHYDPLQQRQRVDFHRVVPQNCQVDVEK